MSKSTVTNLTLVAVSAFSLVGCSNLPGSKGTQGAVIGGASGATVGAVVGGGEHRALGALLGGALGAAGGYVVGANSDRILGRDHNSAEEAARRSQERPATAEDARRATTADLNNDGFVTLDEVVAMRDAGFTESQMLDRMRATSQVFELTPDQRQYLLDRGVSRYVVDQMESINKSTRDRLMTQPGAYPAPSAPVYPNPNYPGTVTTPQGFPPTTAPAGTPPIIGQPPASVPRQY